MAMVQICENAPSLGVQLSARSAEAGGAAVPLAETHHAGDNVAAPEPCRRASLSAHVNDAFVLVARWMAKDIEARKQMRADMLRQRQLYSRMFMTWMSNTQFMPALVSSSDEGSDDDHDAPHAD